MCVCASMEFVGEVRAFDAISVAICKGFTPRRSVNASIATAVALWQHLSVSLERLCASWSVQKGTQARASPPVQVLKEFVALAESGEIKVVRVKDRFAESAGGWRDVMLNFSLTSDPAAHICEVQVARFPDGSAVCLHAVCLHAVYLQEGVCEVQAARFGSAVCLQEVIYA